MRLVILISTILVFLDYSYRFYQQYKKSETENIALFISKTIKGNGKSKESILYLGWIIIYIILLVICIAILF